MQVPDWQVFPPVQVMPQPPQLLLSVWLFLQAPVQQMPPLTRLVTQLVEQAPQAVASVFKFLHTPLQSVRPEGHLHAPAWHVLPPVQTFPQPPQLLLSDWLSLHEPVQQMPPLPRLVMQLVVQAPQAVLSVFRFLQTPLQSVRPEGHLHAPA